MQGQTSDKLNKHGSPKNRPVHVSNMALMREKSGFLKNDVETPY